MAAENSAEEQVEELRAQKDDILLKVRSEEAERAREEARDARQQLRAYQSEEKEQELMQAQREAEQARAEIEQLRREIEDLEARQTKRGILLTFGNVLFATDKAELKPGAELSTGKLADFLMEHQERQILIEGHTDSRGTGEYNQRLSQRRAQAVADALQARGVSGERMTVRGLGENYPIAPNTSASGRQQNRRVEILIQNDGSPDGGYRGS